jgi:hypothetical protein
MVRIAFMLRLRALAPTVTDALKAIEMGCRKVQDDPHFSPMMSTFMSIENDYCFGCLATCALMQLTDTTANDLIAHFPHDRIKASKEAADRRDAFGFEGDIINFQRFEYAIDSLRDYELYPLLSYYGLDRNEQAIEAITWLREQRKETLIVGTTKDDLRKYTDFLKDELIPRVERWFAAESSNQNDFLTNSFKNHDAN